MKEYKVKNEYKGIGLRGHWKYIEWEFTLRYGGKEMVIPSFKFSASQSGGPDFDQVMESLIMDYIIYKNTSNYEDYCEYKGYEDSIKTRYSYLKLVDQSKGLERFLGDDDIEYFIDKYEE